MTISPWLIYWIDVVHSICTFGNILLVVSFITFWGLMFYSCDNEKDEATYNGGIKILFWTLVVGGVITIFIPSKSVMMQMLIIPPVVNNEQVRQLPDNVLEYVNEWLKEAKKDLEEKE